MSVEGRKWSLVAKHVAGRSDVQCRERYMNVLDPSLKADPWASGVLQGACRLHACFRTQARWKRHNDSVETISTL